VIDGHGGEDVLYISGPASVLIPMDPDTPIGGSVNGAAPVIRNVEVIHNANVGEPVLEGGVWTNGAVLNLANVTGLRELWSDFSEAESGIYSAIYKNAALNTVFGVTGVGEGVAASVDLGIATSLTGTADTLKLALDGDNTGGEVGVGWNNNANSGIETIAIDVEEGNATQLKFAGNATVKNIVVTGAGDLTIGISPGLGDEMAKVELFDASAATGDITWTTGELEKAATILGGAGDDSFTLNGSKAFTVDTGAGDDKIDITKGAASNKLNVQAGDGDDVVTLSGAKLATSDVIDGGEGTDTIAISGSAIPRTEGDFIMLNSLLKNFETLSFTSNEGADPLVGAFDASKLSANYTTLEFAAGTSYVTNVGTQALVTHGNLFARAEGFVAPGEGIPPATEITYAGSLDITVESSNGGPLISAVTAGAESVELNVEASKGDVTATLLGFAKTAEVTLTQGVNNGGTKGDTSDDTFYSANFTLATAPANLQDLESLTLSGNGSAVVTNTVLTKLATVDASGLNSVDINGDPAQGLTYISTNLDAETVILGDGLDFVSLTASFYGAVNARTFDTIEGLNLVVKAGVLDHEQSDSLLVAGVVNAQIFTTTQTDLDLALTDAAAEHSGGAVVFHLGGDTYIYSDITGTTAGVVDATDTLVKLVGTIDLDDLLVALEPL